MKNYNKNYSCNNHHHYIKTKNIYKLNINPYSIIHIKNTNSSLLLNDHLRKKLLEKFDTQINKLINRMSSSPHLRTTPTSSSNNLKYYTPIESSNGIETKPNSESTGGVGGGNTTVSKDLDINKLASNYANRASNPFERNTTIQMDRMRDELVTSIKSAKDSQIDPANDRYPCCIVWTPLPLITWFIPFIGHMGICTSAGIIRDFAGPYFVSVIEKLLDD